jgi:CBS domain-containing protein
MTQMIARDVMTAKVISLTADMTLRQIAKILMDNAIGGAPVIDGEGSPVGMVTERDLIAEDKNGERKAGRERWLAQLAEGEPLNTGFLAALRDSDRTAADIMSRPMVAITETTEQSEIARLLIEHRIKRLPVLTNGRVVGIVSQADLVRQMAQAAPETPAAAHHEGLFSEALASLDEHFGPSHPPMTKEPSTTGKTPEAAVTADAFGGLVEAFDHQKAHHHDEERQAATEQRKALVTEMTEHHIEDKDWQSILHRAKVAAETGQKEMLLLRFPCELCSDGGRAINAPQADWPETLRGEAAEIYHLWERDLKPTGFHLTAQVIDFPGGIPGDIGLTLLWGTSSLAKAE